MLCPVTHADGESATMQDEFNLRIPGPTPLPPEVRAVMSRQMINHRGAEYGALQREVIENLRHFFQTDHDVLLFSASGTGGLEAAIVNTLSAGDHVLSISIGVFGDRFARIASAYGLNVRRLDVEWGSPADPEAVERALLDVRDCRAILVTCNETSTGVMNNIGALADVVQSSRSPRPLFLVDAVSALGATNIPMDELGIDVLITGSQKAWMAPPGMTMLGVSPNAWTAHATARLPRFYWDFTAQRNAQAKHQDAWTPSVTTMFALGRSLEMMRAEGREQVFARHARIAAHTRQQLRRIGLTLFAKPGSESVTVTSARVPQGVDGKVLLRHVQEHHGVILGDGQARLAGQILRVGHMGWVTERDIDIAIAAIERSVSALAPVPAGAGDSQAGENLAAAGRE
jgi:aspartate aminotransferase-like enzyme